MCSRFPSFHQQHPDFTFVCSNENRCLSNLLHAILRRDCGVHVLIWLNNWKPGVTFDYGADEVGAYRRDLMWWVVNHEMNSKREDALRLMTS